MFFVMLLAEVSFHSVVTWRFCKQDLYLFFMEGKSLDCLLCFFSGFLIIEDDKGLASHAEVFVCYNIDDVAELGECRLEILLEDREFD